MENLMRDFQKHLSHYLVLLLILLAAGGMFYFLRFKPFYQMTVILLFSFAYVLWGVIHHWLAEDLHLKIIVEYLLIGLLVNLVIFSLLFRA
jgi:hypothetical protein